MWTLGRLSNIADHLIKIIRLCAAVIRGPIPIQKKPLHLLTLQASSTFVPLRREDTALLTGRACFVHDVQVPDAAHVVFVRSSQAHGRLTGLDTAAARSMPGVLAVYTAQHLGGACMPPINPLLEVAQDLRFPLMAQTQIAHAGQPVAMVVASTLAAARTAAEAVHIEVESEASVPDFEGAQAVTRVAYGAAVPLHDADTVASTSIVCPRVVAMTMEPRALMAEIVAGSLKVWTGSQAPSRMQSDIASLLALDAQQVHVVTPNVGGAFGAKSSVYPEELLVCWAAWQMKRSLRWASTRSEEFASAMHGRGARLSGSLQCRPDGQMAGLQADLDFALGAWLPFSAVVPLRNAARILPGPYRVQALQVQGQASLSHAAPVNIYRGAGRPEAALLMETLVEMAARRLGMDPVALRLRNLVASHEMPYETPTGEVLDSGDYAALLQQACDKFAYPDERAAQARRRQAGECVGIGMALYIEPCGKGWESARVTLLPNGRVEVASGSPAQGQGHLTTFARIAAQELGVAADQVDVLCGDTAACPAGIGALASRSVAIGGSAIAQACRDAKSRRDAGQPLPIVVETRYESAETWSSGCVLVRMAIDTETGHPHIEKVVWVDDAGRIIHPELAHGQLVGGFAQGFGQAMLEEIVYDRSGQLLTGSLMDYAVPRAEDLPNVEIDSRCTPSTTNLLGSKGVGEAGCIGVPAALMNAARDALAPLVGEVQLDFPLRPQRLWQLLQTSPLSHP